MLARHRILLSATRWRRERMLERSAYLLLRRIEAEKKGRPWPRPARLQRPT